MAMRTIVRHRKGLTMRTLRYANFIMTVLAILLGVQLWTTWMTTPPAASSAQAAGIPDGGAQRLMIVDQLKLLNQKTNKLNGLFTSGKARMTITAAPEKKPKLKKVQ